MTDAHFAAGTLDDVMRLAVEAIEARGGQIFPTKNKTTGALELIGVLLEIADPRARLSQTETRGKIFSALGELCWYLARRNDLAFIEYYLKDYKDSADGDEIYGGYGPRLFKWKEKNNLNQVANVTEMLRNKPDSRQTVIQLFDANDIVEIHKDVPCTCTLQFMLRRGELHLLTYMRSNDVYRGLPHDVFCFTMLQEIIARTVEAEVGTYKHAVGSLHLYADDHQIVRRFVDEGWQPTLGIAMPRMPLGNPWPEIERLLEAESEIRTTGKFDRNALETVDPYWADLIRLLLVFRFKTDRDWDSILALRGDIVAKVYLPFIDTLLRKLSS